MHRHPVQDLRYHDPRAFDWTRTSTEWFLKPSPLPLGYESGRGSRTHTVAIAFGSLEVTTLPTLGIKLPTHSLLILRGR